MPKKPTCPLQRSECLCAICREILLEPVTLPCNHTLCHPCFQMTVEKASLCCPFCRLRVSSWARRNARSGTLVNQELWKTIQRQYPEECHRRACGLDTEEDDFEDGFTPHPAPQICEPGEIRQEYEAEITKIEAERLRREEEERKASEEYIHKLLAEEEAEQRLSLERSQRELEEQMKKDEELARMLNSDLNESTASSVHMSPVESPVIHRKTVNAKSCKNVKGKETQSGDIERFLLPTSAKIFRSESCRSVRIGALQNMHTIADNVSVLLEDYEDSMPILSPQSCNGCPIDASDSELQLPGLTKYSPIKSSFQPGGSSKNKDLGQMVTNETVLTMTTADFSPPRCSSSLDSSSKWENSQSLDGFSMPEHWHKPTSKRAIDFFGNTENQPSEKRPCLASGTTPEFRTERLLMELKEILHEKKLQEEQDRLLALKLQKLMDKEVKQVSRQKGSPDEYKLRPKLSAPQQKPMESATPKRIASDQNSSESGESSENLKPASKKHPPSHLDRDRRRKTAQPLSPNGEKILQPSNKQQTIMDMFQRSTRK
ncbi:E3 ubiquitin-protein ligase RNF168 isoform 1-T2 [Mantella aurantiaca]